MIINFDNYKKKLETLNTFKPIGKVVEVIGLVIEADGPSSSIGDLCHIQNGSSEKDVIWAEVVGFRADKVLLMPLGDMDGLKPGAKVINSGGALEITVGSQLLGRVLDGLGQPIDDAGAIRTSNKYSTKIEKLNPLTRKRIHDPLSMGVRSIDGFMTIGKGQRVGIFAGSGVGKSTTLGMIARNTSADLNVIALIGERGREVREFIENSLGEEGLKRSVVVVATSDQPSLVKIEQRVEDFDKEEWLEKREKMWRRRLEKMILGKE